MLPAPLLLFLILQFRKSLTASLPIDGSVEHLLQFDVESAQSDKGRRIISINDHTNTYGPTIRTNIGDEVKLSLRNKICSAEESELGKTDPLWNDYCETALHFHGLAPIGNANDGVPGLLQAAIKRDEEYWYNFTIPESACGTFWYHSHSSVQYGDGLRGVFLVDCPEFDLLANAISCSLDGATELREGPLELAPEQTNIKEGSVEEHTLALSDWYDDFGLDVLHDAVLSYDGTTDPHIDGSSINGLTDDNLEFGLSESTETLILRILNTGMSGTQVLNLGGHQLVIMETDGILIKPYVVETLSLAVGQRVTAVVKLNDDVKSGKASLKLTNGCNKMMGYIQKTAWFLKGNGERTKDLSRSSIKDLPGLNKNELFRELEPTDRLKTQGLWDVDDIQRIELDYSYDRDQDTLDQHGTGMYKVNGRTFEEFFKHPFQVKSGQITEIIINSIDHMRHPWHLHGQPFQVVSIGTGHEGPLRIQSSDNAAARKYNEDIQYWKKTGRTPMTRDSINIPGTSYAALRIRADEPGLWLLHCHVDWHIAKGLGVVLEVRSLPKEALPASQTTSEVTTTAIPPPSDSAESPKHRLRVLAIYFVIMLAINGVLYWLLI